MNKKYDAVATVGKYTAKDGTEKKRYLTVGAVFENDKGALSLKLDGMPVSPEWSGWISFYDPKPYNAAPNSHNQSKSNGYAPQQDDDIPF